MKFHTAEQIKAIELNASKDISYLQMMKNAGKGCADFIKSIAKHEDNILCLCGKGKNGGDGFVIANELIRSGYKASVILAMGPPCDEDSMTCLNELDPEVIIEPTDVPEDCIDMIADTDIIVDAIFGFGFKGTLSDEITGLIEEVNNSNACVVSVDVPSGVECNTGLITGSCILADYTLAITYRKPCHLLYPGSGACGEVLTIKIGIKKRHSAGVPDAGFFSLPGDGSGILLPDRTPDSHKGDYGRVLSICGSKKYPGAACFAALGAVRIGAGLVFAAFPDEAYPAIATKLCEPVLLPMPSTEDGFFARGACSLLQDELATASVITIGCGLGQGLGQAELLEFVIKNSSCPIIIDADGINLLKRAPQLMDLLSGRAVLTPHPGELARLIGTSIDLVQSKRIELAKAFAQRLNVVMVLKGANTVVASPDNVYVNSTGNPGMAVGGCGDLLAGMISGLVAQGLDIFHAAVAGVYIHGYAGDSAAKRYSMHSMTPSDMINILPEVIMNCE